MKKTLKTKLKVVPKGPKSVPLDQPNRRTIETLFRDILGRSGWRDDYDPLYRKYKEAEEAEEELKDKLLENNKLKALKKKREAAYTKWYHFNRLRKERCKELHLLYLANGITPELIASLNKLILGK